MSKLIRTHLITIGDSQAVLLPSAILEHINITGELELEVQDNQLIIRPATHARAGWAEQFQRMAANGDDSLLDDDG